MNIYIGIHTINIYIYTYIDPMKSIEIPTCGAAFAGAEGRTKAKESQCLCQLKWGCHPGS
jgi:hypothetical protein